MTERPRKRDRISREAPEAFVEWIREQMPWPFTDVDRWDAEGQEVASWLADEAWPAVATAFEGLLREGHDD